jgi:hypothetical protein
MTWGEIKRAPRETLGMELISGASLRAPIPGNFEDVDKFIALRYSSRLPMLGHRVNDIFHILWVERAYGDVYDHG